MADRVLQRRNSFSPLSSEKGAIITMEDLAHEAQWRTPLSFKYKDLNIISITKQWNMSAQIFEMIAPYDLAKMGHNSTKSIQVIVEAERRAYADRNYFLRP
jgi:gamma-glutamyltranspeptidase/glutathione hydrolase